MWIATKCCKSILPLWALPGRIRSLASLQLSRPFPRCPGGLPTGVLTKRKQSGGRRGLAMAPPPGNPPLPSPLPGFGPGEPCVLRPLKPLVLSPGDLAECEWLTLPHPTPSRGTEQWGRTRKPLTEAEKRESVLYMVLI